jgi:anti-sigma factor ChrR (cupin superfamily)
MRIPGLHVDGALDELPWRATSDPGVSWLPLHLEESGSQGTRRGGGVVLIRMEPGRGYAPHRHVGGEDVLVLQGGYCDEQGKYRAGDHVHYPPGSVHAPVALGTVGAAGPDNPACVLYASVPLGIELLRP